MPGERRGGRKKGVPNKASQDLKKIAQQYTPQAMKQLVSIANNSESDSARVSAIKEILDRGYGKATQPLQHSADEGLETLLARIAKS